VALWLEDSSRPADSKILVEKKIAALIPKHIRDRYRLYRYTSVFSIHRLKALYIYKIEKLSKDRKIPLN
jgi:hypothetical protein